MIKATISNPTSFMNKMAKQFSVMFPEEKDYINIEKAIFNYAIKESRQRKVIKKWENSSFVSIYISRFRSILTNLKNNKLIELIQANEITIQELENITHYEMNPPKWKELIEKKIIREQNDLNSNELQASTDMFTCNKCKSKKCTYYELQTRSADEPATIFVTCINCGKNWRS